LPCERLRECPLFNTTLHQPGMRVWRELYCDSLVGYAHCVRLEMFRRGETPSTDLLPNGQHVGEVLGAP